VDGDSKDEGRERREGVSVVEVMEVVLDDKRVNDPERDVDKINDDDD
jgi:hypothetical protein